jgi:hypothetical protein
MHQPLLSPRVPERLAALPELTAVAAFSGTAASVGGHDGEVTAVDPAQLPQVLSLQVTSGALADLGTGAIAVSREAATTLGLGVGSPVTVRTAAVRASSPSGRSTTRRPWTTSPASSCRWPTSWSLRPTTGRWPTAAA